VRGYNKIPDLLNWPLGGASYIIGALIYINRIPERFRPGKHDIWGSSHQIFHICVIIGVIFHYFGSLNSFYYRLDNACPAF
jgi:adiponectin receptor